MEDLDDAPVVVFDEAERRRPPHEARRCWLAIQGSRTMLKGSREGILHSIQPVSIHGQISLDVRFVYPDDADGQLRVARVGPETVAKGLEPGDAIRIDFLVGQATAISRA